MISIYIVDLRPFADNIDDNCDKMICCELTCIWCRHELLQMWRVASLFTGAGWLQYMYIFFETCMFDWVVVNFYLEVCNLSYALVPIIVPKEGFL